jgi:uncharacterized membrane protein YfcA
MVFGHSIEALAAAAAIMTLGVALQSAVGFGMGLVTVPLLLWTGRALPEAVALLLGASAVQCAYGTWTSRTLVPWRSTLPVAVAQWMFVPLGVAGMAALASAGPDVVKQAVGAIVAGILVLRAVVRPSPTDALPRAWAAATGAASGFLVGLVGMGGPPLVLYALAHDWDKDAFRGFLWSSFLLALPAAAIVLAIRLGVNVLGWSAFGLALLPLLWLGSKAGLALSHRWDAARMRTVATAMLVLIATWSVLGPLLVG